MTQISFARGFPGPDLLPLEEFGECAKAALARDGATAMNYGPPLGYPPLREWIADRHDVPVECVMVTNGSLQAFNFIARHHVQAGDKVFVEAPCYDRSLQILRRLGAEVEAVPLTDEGVDVDALDEALGRSSGPSLVYTIPTFQNPSGRTLSEPSRRRLLEVARSHGATVLEDDPYGLLRFGSPGGNQKPRGITPTTVRGDPSILNRFPMMSRLPAQLLPETVADDGDRLGAANVVAGAESPPQ